MWYDDDAGNLVGDVHVGPWDKKENRTSLLQKVRDNYDLTNYQVEEAKGSRIIRETNTIAQSESAEEEERAVRLACEDLWAKVEEKAKPLLKALREIAG